MSWKPINEPDEQDVKILARHYAKKARFLVDESLGIEVAKFLESEGWNTRFAADLGLVGHSDENAFSAAWKEERILLTHDRDFLDDRRFPPHRNPGVVVLPGAEGNEVDLLRALTKMLLLVGKRAKWAIGAKFLFSADETVTVIRRNEQSGAMERTRYMWPSNGPVLIWEEGDER